MNSHEVTQTVVQLHGLGMVTEPAPIPTDCESLGPIEPVDELSCDDCQSPVGWVTDGEGGAEFCYYELSKPHSVVVVLCEDCAGA